ncbi:MAG TPA: hypothetical protein VFL47_08900 [Flavisolibacter sp.]|nr:hypothetical protein [Flavisolibacter sp.]
MFNISKGKLSLDLHCVAGKVRVTIAPDNQSSLPINLCTLIRSYEALASGYLKLHQSENPEAMLAAYFQSIQYTVKDLPPRMVRNEVGDWIACYR